MELESGKYYWMRHKSWKEWKPILITEESGGRLLAKSITGLLEVPVDMLKLQEFEIRNLYPPSDYPTVCPICGGKLEADEEWLASEYGEHQENCPVDEIPFECQQCGEVDTYSNLEEMAKALRKVDHDHL